MPNRYDSSVLPRQRRDPEFHAAPLDVPPPSAHPARTSGAVDRWQHPALDRCRTDRILLYCPDNGVTQNFMPHLWMFLLQALTPPGHQVLLIDGNTQPLTDAEQIGFFCIAPTTA